MLVTFPMTSHSLPNNDNDYADPSLKRARSWSEKPTSVATSITFDYELDISVDLSDVSILIFDEYLEESIAVYCRLPITSVI
jgi:hypothetical protein